MSEKNYLGSGWKKTFENGGSLISLSVNLDKLKALPVDNYGNVRLVVGELRQLGKAKQTHSVYEDNYKRVEQTTQTNPPEINSDDVNIQMPF